MKKLIYFFINYYKRTDKLLISLCLTCSAFSCVVLYSISEYFFSSKRYFLIQLAASLIGILVAFIISKIDYKKMTEFNKYHAMFAWGLVFLTFLVGIKREEADDKAWLMIPFINLTIQPTEIAKISFVLTFATHLNKVKAHINDLKTVFLLCVHAAIPVLIVHFQGDDGTALVFLFIFMMMIFIAGISYKYIISFFTITGISAPIVWFFIMSEHQRLRLLTTFYPEIDAKGIGFQAYQGKVSIGSGGVWGKGLFSGMHRNIPEVQNDFIFAFISEALGLVGAMFVIFLLLGICFRIFIISKNNQDEIGSYICIGIASIFLAQIFLNIGMCLNIMPVIGVTLPFFSAGGTSVVTMYAAIGVVLSVYVHNNDLWFE